ncbi:MAG: lysylphosphatidylglycerol synthase domain-containing protein, partial [Candidatus Neomarinimicrobiota bacterium]|nr:lysylphosphatidylglycerol synthase domain-containing protein [Candidatus Neomarinimicrobiota bacterium]
MNRWLKLFIGFSLSFVGLHFSFRNIDFIQIKKSFESIDFLYLLAAIILLIFYTLIRAFRWRLLLFSVKSVKIKDLFASNMIGYFGNSVL